MHIISRDSPAFYITAVAKDRLAVFRTDAIKIVTCAALDEARTSGGFSIYAYVVMHDHIHVITGSSLKPSEVLRYIKGISSRRVIDHLKDHGHNSSLQKLRHETRERAYRYSLWEHHSNVFSITSEDAFMQKVNYIHRNAVRASLVKKPEDYRWSSVRWWKRCPREDELLKMDIEQIAWKRGAASR